MENRRGATLLTTILGRRGGGGQQHGQAGSETKRPGLEVSALQPSGVELAESDAGRVGRQESACKSCSDVGWLSFLTFSWVNAMLTKGLRQQVGLEDVPELAAAEDTALNTHRLLACLDRLERAEKSHPLLRAVVVAFWKELLVLQLLGLAAGFSGIIGTLLLQSVLVFQEAQNQEGSSGVSRAQLFAGFAAIAGLLVKGLLDMLYSSQQAFYQKRTSTRIESALRGTVLFRCVNGRQAKGRVDDPPSQTESPGPQAGESLAPSVYNVLSFDVGPNIEIIWIALGLWAFPIQFSVTLMVLFDQVQWAVAPGLAVVLVAKSVCFALMGMDGLLRHRLLAAKDVRLLRCNEGFSGVRTLQMLAWTSPFQENILAARREELRAQQLRLWIKSMVAAIDTSLGSLVSLATLSYYTMVEGKELKASVALPVLSLVGGLIGPLGNFPQWFNHYLVWQSAYGRVNQYLGFESRAGSSGSAGYKDILWKLLFTLALLVSGGLTAFGYVLGWEGNTKLIWGAGWGILWCAAGFAMVLMLDVRQSHAEGVSGSEDGSALPEDAPMSGGPLVRLRGCRLSWEPASASAFKLDGLNLDVCPGDLLVISGEGSSGKSSLLLSLLGEMAVEAGSLQSPAVQRREVDGLRAMELLPPNQKAVRRVLSNSGADFQQVVPYASQTPTLFSGTLRDNVLFDAALEQDLYSAVFTACALDDDLRTMPAADLTELVQGGANLSGGQRARVGLARAAYRALMALRHLPDGAPPPLVLLDDPLINVDRVVAQQVSRALFSRDGGLLSPCAVIVATADPWWLACLPAASVCSERTSSAGLRVMKLRCGDLVEDPSPSPPLPSTPLELPSRPPCLDDAEPQSQAQISEVPEAAKVLGEERRASGSVRWRTYRSYLSAVGLPTLIMLMFSLIGIMVFQNLSVLWITYWTSEDKSASFMHPSAKVFAGDLPDEPAKLLTIYAIFVGCYTLFNFLGFGLEVFGGVHAAKKIFASALQGTLSQPARWWDGNPTGRVLNRFSEDVETMDNAVTYIMGVIFGAVLYFVGHSVVLAVANPFSLALLPVATIGLEYYARYYRATIREVQRIWLTSMSTVYQDMVEAVVGQVTVRAFANVRPVMCRSIEGLDRLQRVGFCKETINLWIGLRMSLIGYMVGVYTTLYPVFQYYGLFSKQSAALVGFSIQYSLETVGIIRQFILNFSDLEMQLVSIERLEEYAHGPDSPSDNHPQSLEISGVLQPLHPSTLGLLLENLVVTYRQGLPPAICNMSFAVAPKEAVAVIGRTGAGKTTLLLAILQMVPYTGRITVDGKSLAALPPEDVRRRLVGIVPQQPLIFEGDVRWNLDPGGSRSDDDLWAALEAAGLKAAVASSSHGLTAKVQSGSSRQDTIVGHEPLILSQAQQQLLCAARVLLRRQRVVLLDEVTAALPQEDAYGVLARLLQNLRACDSALVVVTHQEDLLSLCDRVLTIAAGKAVADDKKLFDT